MAASTELGQQMRRRTTSSTTDIPATSNVNDEGKYFKNTRNLFNERTWIVLGLFYIIVMVIIFQADLRLPKPITINEATHGEFIEERARHYLLSLTSLGPRPVGSYENEILAAEFIKRELGQIKQLAKKIHRIEIDVQKPTGSFKCDFLNGFNSYYARVKNILAKIGPSEVCSHSLLINCHFDSVTGSPGASDDAVSCAVMLEVLNILSQQSEALPYCVVFNFNGAEENFLQASHGFITQHPWAKTIRAFINLEAAGAGGRELVFQAGPEHPWLIQAYAQVAQYPYGTVFGQEIFQSKIIPSDTDFRIYRDYGHIPGIDIAYIRNGYVYHTKFDSPEFIPPGSIQRAGTNLLVTVKAILASPYLADPANYRHGNMVFFDVLGLFMVVYSERMAYILNTVCVIGVFLSLMHNIIGYRDDDGFRGRRYLKYLVFAVVVIFLSVLLALITVICIASCLTWLNRSMSWYGRPYWLFGLYIFPALAAFIFTHDMAKKFLHQEGPRDHWHVEKIFFEAMLLIWSCILAFLTVKNILSGYIALLWVLFPAVIRGGSSLCLRDLQHRLSHYSDRKDFDKSWNIHLWHHAELRDKILFLCIHFLAYIVPLLLTGYLILGLISLFVPVMGRSGMEVIPDIFLATVVCLCLFICVSYVLTLVHITTSVSRLLKVLTFVSLISLFLVIFTPLGFPYSGDSDHPSVQRFVIQHVDRTFYNKKGTIQNHDSGFWIVPLDYNRLNHLAKEMPELQNFEPIDCDTLVYCGMPFYFPVMKMLRNTYYIPAPSFKVHEPLHMKLSSRERLGRGIQRLTFTVTGPDHMVVEFSPKAGVNVVQWSLTDGAPYEGPPWGSRSTYFIFYSHGETPGPWIFWLELQIPDNFPTEEGILDLAMGTHHIHGHDRFTKELTEFLDKFPNWTFPLGWTSTYHHWML